MLIAGYATPEGTARFRDRFAARYPRHFREAQGLWLSSIGLGTYLGDPTAAQDALYRGAVTRAVELGTNVLDSAVNYRHQRSERAIGEALASAVSAGSLRRDEVFLATKGGFLTFDGTEPDDPSAYFQKNFVEPGIVRPDEVAAGCHVMSPAYLENQIEVSRRNLGVETIDLYYVHNPETQLSQVSRQDFYRRLKAAFARLEKAVADGWIRLYGTATWNAYRVGLDARDAVSLAEALRLAEEVGGKDHHFRAVQLPFNLAMMEGLTASTQTLNGKRVPLLRAAQAHRLMVFASASLLQGQLAQGIPQELRQWFPGLKTDAQRALQLVRSTPGITCALVGMSGREHVEENLATANVAALDINAFRALFARPESA
jgi:aryl-alcohol dehydrogenase-like predicted oxidoreductase